MQRRRGPGRPCGVDGSSQTIQSERSHGSVLVSNQFSFHGFGLRSYFMLYLVYPAVYPSPHHMPSTQYPQRPGGFSDASDPHDDEKTAPSAIGGFVLMPSQQHQRLFKRGAGGDDFEEDAPEPSAASAGFVPVTTRAPPPPQQRMFKRGGAADDIEEEALGPSVVASRSDGIQQPHPPQQRQKDRCSKRGNYVFQGTEIMYSAFVYEWLGELLILVCHLLTPRTIFLAQVLQAGQCCL